MWATGKHLAIYSHLINQSWNDSTVEPNPQSNQMTSKMYGIFSKLIDIFSKIPVSAYLDIKKIKNYSSMSESNNTSFSGKII